MPIYNISVDDVSPLLSYSSGQWSDSSTSDSEYVNYLNQTFHATQSAGASVSFQFYGTAVWVFGAKRGNHDRYTVQVDSSSQFANGFAQDPGLYQQVLYSQTGLTNAQHTLTLTDSSTRTDRPWVDVDFVTWTTGDDDDSSTSVDTTIDDSDAACKFTGSGWDASPNGLSDFYHNDTMHRTGTANDQVTITFTGSAIALYGATSTNHGGFSVQIDGGQTQSLSGAAPEFRPQMLLYYASGLKNGTHTATLMNTDGSGGFFDFDYAIATQYFSTSSTNTTSSTSPTSTDTPTGSHHSNVAGIAAGVTVGAVAFIVVFIGLCVLLRRRRRAERGASHYDDASMEQHAKPSGRTPQFHPQAMPYYDNPHTNLSSSMSVHINQSSPSLAPSGALSDMSFTPASAGARSHAGEGGMLAVGSPTSSSGRHRQHSPLSPSHRPDYSLGTSLEGVRPSDASGRPFPSNASMLSPSIASVSDYSRSSEAAAVARAHARNISGSTALSQPLSSIEHDAGPAFNPYDVPPPQYGQVFRPPAADLRDTKTPAFTMSLQGLQSAAQGQSSSGGLPSPAPSPPPDKRPISSREGRALPTVPS